MLYYSMIVIPAIDLKDGQCVRLLQGRKDAVTTYSNDPASTGKRWEACGAKLLHVIDLDGAFTGSPKNLDAIIKIRESVSMDIEVGGGIRDIQKIDALIKIGINRIILGTAVIESPFLLIESCRKYQGKILVAI
ncbi:MAG: 1-(5-phosphoribosyl)-5-((5-phosphoribosylamino)methylideneamino)imidazole-4-carboxamide isomerase, partial [Nitrospirae bacterium]|nr:1-(5-phosphoribosyl)-5-((5-phosphoribosylamino)methylideneamino)imidazole-4-carboxamide isomerase [Nitrospirota bacterium]